MGNEMNEQTPQTAIPKVILAAAGEPKYRDRSEMMGSNYWIIGVMVSLVAGYGVWAFTRMVTQYELTGNVWRSIDYSSTVFVLFALWFLLTSAFRAFYFQLTDTALEVRYRTLTGIKIHRIPYEDIYGVHDHKARLANHIKFRYKWRWYSLLDGRPMYAIFYRIPRKGKLPQYGRIMFKADVEFLLGMNEYLPGKVGITEEETTYQVLVDEGNRRDELAREKAARQGKEQV